MTRALAFDRSKYLRIFEEEGLSAALTALHRDQTRFEFETFDTPAGWRPDAWSDLAEIHAFSRELWNKALVYKNKGGGQP